MSSSYNSEILDKWMFLQEDRQEKIQWLKTEYKIADIEIQLRKILHPGKPDLESIIEHLQELNSLLVRSLSSYVLIFSGGKTP